MAKKEAEAKEPYVHQAFPKVLYALDDKDELITCKVETPDEHDRAVLEGWEESPALLQKPQPPAPVPAPKKKKAE